MNRKLTNVIRFILDECLPPLVRDNKWFMFPFFCLAYRFKNIKAIMHFKSQVYNFSKAEYKEFYDSVKSISRSRVSDLTDETIRIIYEKIHCGEGRIIDIGCGNGFMVRKLKENFPQKEIIGFDISADKIVNDFDYIAGDINELPFINNSFDTVICTHTLEHIININKAISELKRIARKQIIIVVPCQRYYYYTLDEHIHFFQHQSQLETVLGIHNETTYQKIWGDWIVCINVSC